MNDDCGREEKEAGFTDADGGELRTRFLERTTPLIKEAGLTVPEVTLDFSDWDPASRRSNRDGPDEEAVARARGDRNRAFLVE